jgi:serine/threonine-protein kinase
MLINRSIGNYILLRRLAVGGQSEVFLAMKDGPEEYTRPVVIKALPTRYRNDPNFVELFHREAFLSSRFSHPNVVTVHDARVLDGERCMVMDYISGQTVADIAQRGYKAGDPPSKQQSVRIVADACDGLDYTHHFHDIDETEYPVVHRDVSPQNLMVTYQGVTIVFDFGIATVVGRDEDVDTLAGGKYAYMSPEQCREDASVDTRSDIFSLGVILYELTVGTRLFRRGSREEIVAAVTEEEIKAPSELRSSYPPMLEQIVMKALQREPDQRYQTAGEMRDDLRDYLAMEGGDEGRRALGHYVAGLFEQERSEIAEIVRAADELDEPPEPKDGTPLEKLGRGGGSDQAESPVVPMPEPENDENLARELEEAEPAPDGGREVAPEIRETPDEPEEDGANDQREHPEQVARELESLRKRHSILLAVLGVVLIILAALSVLTFVQGPSGFGEQEPVQIGSSPGE